MERKHFLRTSLGLGALCGLRPVAAEQTKAAEPASPSQPAPPTPCERNTAFAHNWVRSFMENLDAQLPESQRVALMEARGRACARGGAIRMAEAHKGNLDAFVAELASHLGPDGVRRDGEVVKVTYPTCYCPLVAEIQEPLSPTYCACSVGWLKEMYETVTGKRAMVAVLETIKRGGKACRFEVRLTA